MKNGISSEEELLESCHCPILSPLSILEGPKASSLEGNGVPYQIGRLQQDLHFPFILYLDSQTLINTDIPVAAGSYHGVIKLVLEQTPDILPYSVAKTSE